MNFNTTLVSVQSKAITIDGDVYFISIQPLCRFNTRFVQIFGNKYPFQYNPCVGSINLTVQNPNQIDDFNTTLVSVQSCVTPSGGYHIYIFQYNPCVGSIFAVSVGFCVGAVFQYNPCVGSIKALCRVQRWCRIFQYNPCVGSIKVKDIKCLNVKYFNTTLVSVQ